VTDSIEEFAVRQLIGRFANSFDLKDWDGLKSCLAESLYTDYSSLRGTPPEIMTRDRFVELRRSALDALTTHHLLGNLETELSGVAGAARVSAVIFRRSASGEVLNTHCIYELKVIHTAGTWRISSIIQTVLWSDGNPRIHKGILAK
jgi:hypothetical protein